MTVTVMATPQTRMGFVPILRLQLSISCHGRSHGRSVGTKPDILSIISVECKACFMAEYFTADLPVTLKVFLRYEPLLSIIINKDRLPA